MRDRELVTAIVRGMAGAIAGGALAYFLFEWLLRHGLYAIALPGALVGISCAMLSRRKSNLLGALCALAGLALAIYLEWSNFPLVADPRLAYFVSHLQDVSAPTLLMILLSGVFGFWFGRGTQHVSAAPEKETEAGA